MKRFFKALLIGILIIAMGAMSGCFLLGGNDKPSSSGSDSADSSDSSNTTTVKEKFYVLIDYDTGTQELNFNEIANIKIEPRYKENYVLNGYYSSPNGEGNRYIDYRGNNVSNSWIRGSTIKLYPHYEPINNNYIYKSAIICEETPDTYSYNIYGNPRCAKYDLKPDRLDYIFKVAVNNPYQKMKITAYADFYDEPTIFSVGIGKDMETGKLKEKAFSKTNSFQTHSISAEITGKTLVNNENNYIIIGLFCQTFGAQGFVKNIYYEISLI